MKKNDKEQIEKIPDFDVLSEEPELCATILKEQLQMNGYKGIKIVTRETNRRNNTITHRTT